MSATEKLREMLDERGIEWWYDPNVSPDHTEWMTDHMAFTSLGSDGDMLAVKTISKMTPEQAIDATMGRETCTLPKTPDPCAIKRYGMERYGVAELCKCSACGAKVLAIPAHYCPNCGRKVIE